MSSEETTTDTEIDSNNATNKSLDQPSGLSRQESLKSISLSIDENELNETQVAPIEVAEIQSSGKVSRSIYLSYISAGGNIFKISFLLFICIFTQLLGSGGDYWISYW